MPPIELPQNLIPSDPQTTDVLKAFKRDLMLNFNCHHLGTVQSFDPEFQTAKVTINYKKAFYTIDERGRYLPKLVDYPVIVAAPAIFVGGGGYALTFPVDEGDECLVLFNDRNIDNWFAGSSNSAPATQELHAFGDALIIVGLRSKANAISDFSSDGPELRNKEGDKKFSISEDAVRAVFGENVVEVTEESVTLTFGTATVTLNESKFTVSVGPTTILELDTSGTFSVQNAIGELISILADLFGAINPAVPTGGGPVYNPVTYPAALIKLQTFKA